MVADDRLPLLCALLWASQMPVKSPPGKPVVVAAFDFDGTLTKRDTFMPFLARGLGWPRFLLALLKCSPWLAAFAMRLTPNHVAKQKLMRVTLKGKTIRVITGSPPELDSFKPYFENVSVVSVMQNGVPFYVVEGAGFNYSAYQQGVLGDIFKRFYNIPQWLPMTGCPFCVRYCGQVRCP